MGDVIGPWWASVKDRRLNWNTMLQIKDNINYYDEQGNGDYTEARERLSAVYKRMVKTYADGASATYH